MKPWLISLPTIAACIWFAPAAHAVLKTGDPAPKIQVSAWAQGDEVKEFEGDKVYIVEFWATWCGPCVASIPHINDIQKKYKDKGLVVIGQNLGEDKKTVTDFIKQMGGKMGYRVTVDDKSDGGWMGKHWLTAAGQNGIPCAFVVNKKGSIAYIGHPMSLKEEVLEKLLGEPSTKSSAEPAAPAEDAAPSAKATELATRAKAEIAAGKLAEAEATIAQLQEALPAKFGYIGGLAQLDLLIAQKQPGDAVELSKLLCEDYAKQPAVVAEVAAHLVAQQDPAASLKAAAEKIATPLAATAGPAQANASATLARIASLK
ncbi:redoxin family protein [Luteolibacter ambystomatis]|uniref:Redoxin family protein n=1 Tax=Luteolibacter ambystomatis TaxID=2824561 RepID=A0A975PGH4_9BACT|nr:redoxin family protein [Luteolibacter ambystomatis]QUE52734.1 redoxin family protein [Luteolibacter ambystomatis]